MKKNKYQLKSNLYFNQTIIKNIDEFVNIIFNDCLDIYGKFDNVMFEDLKSIYEEKINAHLNNICDSYKKIYKN